MTNEKLDLASPDLVNENFEKLAQLFPNCVTESTDGKAIDFDLLKQELSHAVVEGTKERYRLEWPGKREAIVTANLPTTKTLRPVREDSVDFDNTENLYIEGDNLEVLKLLQESYLGKIKMIYIDPPYNTGKDFVYKDNFTQDSEEYKEESGLKDEYNQRLQANPDTSGRYHSDWLSMMYPRLKLARNLLTDDGVIFISIDDNEVHNLRKICDEIFGEICFVSNAIWRSKDNSNNDAKGFSTDHNHTLVYSKNQNWQPALIKDESKQKHFKNPDNDPRGPYFDGNPLNSPNYRENLIYNIKSENGTIIEPPKNGWRWSKKVMQEKISTGEIRFTADQKNIRRRTYLQDMKGLPPSSLMIDLDKTGHNRQAKYELLKLMPEDVFDTPKPIKLIKYLMNLGNIGEGDIVLDFFSGSATSAHAVIDANSEDNNKRKFIQIQLPENTDEKTDAYKKGYKNITDIGKERIRRASKNIKEETSADIDYGFRVYRLDDSNMQDVYYKPQEYSQENLELFSDNIKPDRTADDLVAQVMLDWGLPLSLKIEQALISGKKVFKVSENSLFACFDNGIDEAFAKEIAKEAPLRIVFKDSGFKDDTAKTNVKQLLKQLSPETEMKVI
ncbi:site-specific DNA-methyltransferase [Winogradskyella sp. SYSU M77433]|uniref:site-specific DNA-methyltransferase n=1 Tax=Winogradskyella sp. SYSU M77433 TaxID=3042722 RepID=UPI0024806643|nr:site-specific DNA-methyltransferase [Winogradskyella sp. SYSU M77433]MDH7913470.1 site-specific DNA-methyltransferase [Winogradskyella sp. SYSU M77433]